VPEITEFLMEGNDSFCVIATDGVWEFLSNQEIAEIVAPFYTENQPEAAANAIIRAAYEKWREVRLFKLLTTFFRKRKWWMTLQ
jgi:serine/threonine protein phosphatase PrpC